MILRQLGYRIAVSVPVLLGVVILGFVLMMLTPTDPASIIAGEGATPAVLEQIRRDLGLDRSVVVQFVRYVERLIVGDFGRSLLNGSPVISELARTVVPTAELLVAALLMAVPMGIGLGSLAARWQGGMLDRIVMAFAVIGMSAPVFMTGLLLINIVGVHFAALPVQGRGGPVYTLQGLEHLVLPTLTLVMILVGPIARMTRTSMMEVSRKDFVRTARSKGIGESRVVRRHILRNALIPTVNLIGLQAGYLLGGIVITETVFAWPGMGRLAVSAISSGDTPVAQGTILFLALSFLVINILVDLISALLDPRAQSV